MSDITVEKLRELLFFESDGILGILTMRRNIDLPMSVSINSIFIRVDIDNIYEGGVFVTIEQVANNKFKEKKTIPTPIKSLSKLKMLIEAFSNESD